MTVCSCMWNFKMEFCENADPHIFQENVFSPVCICSCFFQLEFRKNADPHI